jgi:hypothetical protein
MMMVMGIGLVVMAPVFKVLMGNNTMCQHHQCGEGKKKYG